jgi:hypothetical protein
MSSYNSYSTPAGFQQAAVAPSQGYSSPLGTGYGSRVPSATRGNGYLELGKFGATVALCGAAASNLRRVQAEQITVTEAAFDSLRTGVAAGLATAAAGYVANQFRDSTTSLVATLVTGTAMMYFLNTEAQSNPAQPQSEGDAS